VSVEQRFEIVRSIGEECIQDDELFNLLANKKDIVCYDGFDLLDECTLLRSLISILQLNVIICVGV